MEETNCSMQNVFEWCLRNQMAIEFYPLSDGYSVKVTFSKRVLGQWCRWSHAASLEHVNQMAVTPSRYWSTVVSEAMHQLSEEKILADIEKED